MTQGSIYVFYTYIGVCVCVWLCKGQSTVWSVLMIIEFHRYTHRQNIF